MSIYLSGTYLSTYESYAYIKYNIYKYINCEAGLTMFGNVNVNTLEVNSTKCEKLFHLLRENKLDSNVWENREKDKFQ